MYKLSEAEHAVRQIDETGAMIGISREWYEAAKAKLTAYERTDLTPEEVAELARAKAEGRLVVLPCKPGDTIYAINPQISIFRNYPEILSLPFRGVDWMCKAFGDTIFLTREAAEAALVERTEGADIPRAYDIYCQRHKPAR